MCPRGRPRGEGLHLWLLCELLRFVQFDREIFPVVEDLWLDMQRAADGS